MLSLADVERAAVCLNGSSLIPKDAGDALEVILQAAFSGALCHRLLEPVRKQLRAAIDIFTIRDGIEYGRQPKRAIVRLVTNVIQ